ncbi:uncharacterized protein TrAFT101_000541 [Trichoderma asperellum]|uniref:uncharacterized protein n=1 Tax=Trichoderma asperellum TaxID=101201 RepID=UPI00331E7F6D|nr:hypothetical protein TrAFT101_000541 [Trichoderma asperellum]
MSIFSRLRKSRQQAKEHNAKLAEQEKKEEGVKTPYKHVPKHAAADAIASAPPSWREDDRHKIQEQNRRRSAMAASGHSMNMPGVPPRVGSSLSHVSYPADKNATPMVRLPRAYSYTGVSPYTSNHSRHTVSSMPDVGSQFAAYAASTKGKEVVRGSGYDTSRTSPTSSQEESESSSGSTSSQDDLEMRLNRPPVVRPPTGAEMAARRPRPGSRRTSDSAIGRIAMANSTKAAARDSRPPPSMRNFGSIAPIVHAPAPILRVTSHPQGDFLNPHHRQKSETSFPSSLNTSLNTSAATLVSASALPSIDGSPSLEQQELKEQKVANSGKLSKEQKAAKVVRLAEGGRIQSGTKKLVTEKPAEKPAEEAQPQPVGEPASTLAIVSTLTPAPARESAPNVKQQQSIVINVFPEADSIPDPEPTKKSSRFTKGGNKMAKKSRWAKSKARPIAV